MAAATDILFVAAAGNEDTDNTFGEFVPGAFDGPNVITTAAVVVQPAGRFRYYYGKLGCCNQHADP